MADRSTTPHNSGYTIAARVDGSGTNGSRINVWVEYALGAANHTSHTIPLTAYFYADLKDGKTSSTSSSSGTSSSFSVNGVAGTGHSGGCDFTTVGKVNQWGYWSGNISFSRNGTASVAFSGSAKTHSTYISGGSISGNISVSYTLNFTISYNKGSGSGTNTSDTQGFGDSYTTKGAIFSKTGYTQTGWSLNSDDGVAEYSLNQTFPAGSAFGSSVTLYPTWTINNYDYNLNILLPDGSEPYQTGEAGTVECSINNGSWSRIYNEAAMSYPYGTTFRFRNFSPGTGLALDRVTGATANSDGTWSATLGTGGLNINFYTKIGVYTLYYDGNGGTVPNASVSVNGGSTTKLPTASQCTRRGAELLGFSKTATATSASYLPGASYTVSTNGETLYAIWMVGDIIWVKNSSGVWKQSTGIYIKLNGTWIGG